MTPIPQATAGLYSPGMDLDRAHCNLIDAAALVAMAEHLDVSPLDAQEMIDIARRLIREALTTMTATGSTTPAG